MMIQDEPIAKLRPIAAIFALGLLGAVAAIFYFVSAAQGAPSVPAPTITSSPANPTTSTSATFAYKDTQSGVSFKCALDTSSFSTCATTGVSYSSLSYGSHTFKVEAISGSNTSTQTSYTWSVIPPTPTITAEPSNPTISASAAFKYTDSLSGVSFECSLNGGPYSSCPTSGVTYTMTSSGGEAFAVEAISNSTASAAASYAWTVNTPAPSIVTEPANPTSMTSALFTYSDSQSGVSFKCSLDSATFSSCSASGISYSGLGNATHTFKLEAELGSGPVSAVSSYSWVVDTTPPTINMTFPDALGVYSPSTWAKGCSPAGICGTASDPVGVTNVSVAILQWFSGDYWNGSSFSASSMVFNSTTGTTTWHYPLAAPPVGIYTVYVKATDTLGNTTSGNNLYEAAFLITSNKPAAIAVSSGSPQSATVHSAFSNALVALVTDSGGLPVSGVTVTFIAPSSGASGSFAPCGGGNPTAYECEVTTNSSGLATSSTFTANTTAGGPYTVAATVSGVSGAANFSLTNNPGTATQLAVTSVAVSGPASQSATLGPITVQVEDSYGNAVKVGSNTTAKLVSSSTGGIFSASSGGTKTTSVTILSGSASTSFYYGDDISGSPKITVSSGTLTSASQTVSISKASPTLSATGPSNGAIGVTIPSGSITSVLASSSGSNTRGTITFQVFGPQSAAPTNCTSGGQNIGTPVPVSGNGSYNPTVGFKPTSAGDYFWYSSYNGDANNKAATSLCGSLMSETMVSGSTATKLAFTTSAVTGAAGNNAGLGPITVTAENSSNAAVNVASNTTVTLSSTSTGPYFFNTTKGATSNQTTVTILAGQSSVSFYFGDEKAGSPSITASSPPLTSASQVETINPGAAVISMVSGNNQSTTMGTAFANPLVVNVADQFGNLIPGASVTFTAPDPGASGNFSNNSNTITASPDGTGQVSETLTANMTGGQYDVSASAGTNTIQFVLLNGMNFDITGPSGLPALYPGTSEALNVTLYNPNPEAITVPLDSLGGDVSGITGGGSNTSIPACMTSWFTITNPTTTATVSVGAGQTVSLSDLGVAEANWPVLSMSDLKTINQDNCEGASLTLSLSGTGSGS